MSRSPNNQGLSNRLLHPCDKGHGQIKNLFSAHACICCQGSLTDRSAKSPRPPQFLILAMMELMSHNLCVTVRLRSSDQFVDTCVIFDSIVRRSHFDLYPINNSTSFAKYKIICKKSLMCKSYFGFDCNRLNGNRAPRKKCARKS